MKLKVTNKSNNLVYSLICMDRNDRILMNKIKSKNKLRQSLVGQISHDLRTPLNAIIILLNLVVKDVGEISDKVKKEYLFPALQNSKYLLVLLNDILDFTQEEFNKEPRLVFETVNVKDIIETIKVTL